MAKLIEMAHNFTANGVGDWVKVGPYLSPAQFQQLIAKGDLGGGSLTIEGALVPGTEDPNVGPVVPASHVVPIPSVVISDLATDDPVLFATKLLWIRPVLSGAPGAANLNVWIL